jgi:hypothetical protein
MSNKNENALKSRLFVDNIYAVRAITHGCLGLQTRHIATHIDFVTEVLKAYHVEALMFLLLTSALIC